MCETAIRTFVSDRRRLAAFVMNLILFAIGVYFEAHPRDRRDAYSAAAVAAIAVMNSGALTIPSDGAARPLVRRLRRIALYVNTSLVPIGIGIVAVEGLHDWRQGVVHAGALVVPPLVMLAALTRSRPSERQVAG